MCSKWFRATACVGLFALAACPTRDISQLSVSPAIEIKKEIPVSTNRNVDILFVIDNSTSMADKQNAVASNFTRFIDVLNAIPGGLPNVHIGVVSSDVGVGIDANGVEQCTAIGDHGLLQNTPRSSCMTMNNNARYIEDIGLPNGTRQRNYPTTGLPAGTTDPLSAVFSCVARLGTSGCGFENHLESMKEALDGMNAENAGFLRNDAYLAVVILGDEDDCSARDQQVFDPRNELDNINSTYGVLSSFRCTEFGVQCDGGSILRAAKDYQTCVPRGDSYLWHPQHYFDYLRSLKSDPNLLIGAVIAGNTTPFGVTIDDRGAPQLKHSCNNTAVGAGDPAIRLKYFVDQFGSHGTFVSICNQHYDDALAEIGQLLAKVIGTPCLEGAVDTTDIDPTQPGLQMDCQVSDVKFPNTANSTETVLPRCAMTDANTPVTTKVPCWWTKVDAATCTSTLSETHVALHVERGGADAPIGTYVVAKCVSD